MLCVQQLLQCQMFAAASGIACATAQVCVASPSLSPSPLQLL